MSFSSDVKKELLAVQEQARHCQIAELAAMLGGAGRIQKEGSRMHVTLITENEHVAQRFADLLAQAGGITAAVTQAHHIQQKNKTSYLVDLYEDESVQKLFLLLKIIGRDGRIRGQMTLTDGQLLRKSCCKRAFLRGAFLAAGSISNPKRSYHFEIVCTDLNKARQMQEQLAGFALEAKIVQRKTHQIVYLKEGAQIVDVLNVMGAHNALMNLENVRILKEMRNDINRRVNCETANINKTVNAAYRQQEAIRFLQQQGVLNGLPWQLQEIAGLRMEHPDATIQELGRLCDPEVGKSGVNHRLRRLGDIAKQMGFPLRDFDDKTDEIEKRNDWS